MKKFLIVLAITSVAWLIDWAMINIPIILSEGIITWLLNSSNMEYIIPHPKVVIFITIITFAVVLFLVPNFEDSNKDHPASLSKDKKNAMHPCVPKEFLSKEPHHLTVGTYGKLPKQYVNIPFFQSPDHMLIIGSPGSQKTTTLLNMLLYNFNFSEIDEKGGADDVME